MGNKKLFDSQTLAQVSYLSYPVAAPDGINVLYVTSKADDTDGKFYSKIYRCSEVSGNAEILFKGLEGSQKLPSYSPDGTKLAFLSDASGEYQVWIYDMDTAVYDKVTTFRHGVNWFSWSPKGDQIAVEADFWSEELASGLYYSEMSAEEKAHWLAERDMLPIVIEEIAYKHDKAFGCLNGSVAHVLTVNLQNHQVLNLTEHAIPSHFPVWSDNGEILAFFGQPYHDAKAFANELFLYEGGAVRQITHGLDMLAMAPPIPVDDGVIISAIHTVEESCDERLFKIAYSDGTVTPLLPEVEDGSCHCVNNMPASRTVYGIERPYYQRDASGAWIYFLSAWKGRNRLFRVSTDSNVAVETVLEGEYSIQSFYPPVNGRIYCLSGNTEQIADLYVADENEKTLRRLTVANPWLSEYCVAKTHEMWVDTADKTAQIHGWVMYPANFEEGKKYPAVLEIHGGPECSYVAEFWHEFQALAAAGITVIYCDPRGSFGYGLEHARSEYAWGDAAYQDLLTFIDAAVALGFIDAGRIGVTGGSYGGYMVNKYIGTTDRFKAAVTQRSLVNTATSYGTGDMGFESAKTDDLSTIKMLDVLTKRARKSLIHNIDKMKTPLLILHGYKDYRCTFEQAEQLFIAMKERNPEVPVRLVMFEEENHEITRTGKLYNQIRHLQEMVDWFVKYL